MSYTASVFLDRNGQYAKAPELAVAVRLYTGDGCEHVDVAIETFNRLPVAEQQALKLLPGRPECM